MHITERLGLDTGRPVTAYEGELLSAFEKLFIEEDFLFLRCGPTITLSSEAGTTIVSVPRADRFSAKVMLVMVPSPALSPVQIKNVITFSSAVQEADQRLLVIERPGQPLIIAYQVEFQRPYTRDSLSSAFSGFAYNTDLALGETIRKAATPEDDEDSAEPEEWVARLRF